MTSFCVFPTSINLPNKNADSRCIRSFRPRFPLIGPSGSNLQDEWSEEAKGYMGLAAPNFPNYMIFLGPNCPIGNGPVLVAIGKCYVTFTIFLYGEG